MCDTDEDIPMSELTVDTDLRTRMGAGHYIIIAPLSTCGTCGQGMVTLSLSGD